LCCSALGKFGQVLTGRFIQPERRQESKPGSGREQQAGHQVPVVQGRRKTALGQRMALGYADQS
jgi:hypothetical protein